MEGDLMIIIYSGGLDSTVLLYEYKGNIDYAVSFNYGSKHNSREIDFAKKNCVKLGINHYVIDLPFFKYFDSSLLKSSGREIPLEQYNEGNMSSTVVPFRNGIFLSIAVGLCDSFKQDSVLIANHSGDHFIYPDCRPEFIQSINNAAQLGTIGKVTIIAPYASLSKKDIALRGKMLGVDFADTWSCYQGGNLHCGECATCIERKEALHDFDTTIYK